MRFYTDFGSFDIELFDQQAPQTVNNFLNYVNRHGNDGYDSTVFHRLVPGFVLQGGGFEYLPNNSPNPNLLPIPTDPAVPNEPGISNTAGTLALAKLGNDPNSGTDQFFINLADNSSNLDNQNGGFTVFGKVLGNGLSVVNQIASLPTPLVNSTTLSSSTDQVFQNIPLQNFPANGTLAQATANNLVLLNNVNQIQSRDVLRYQVTVLSGSQSFVNAVVSISGNTLTLNPTQTGTATIEVQAITQSGLAVTANPFTITVN